MSQPVPRQGALHLCSCSRTALRAMLSIGPGQLKVTWRLATATAICMPGVPLPLANGRCALPATLQQYDEHLTNIFLGPCTLPAVL